MALAEPFRRFRDRLARQGRLDGFSPCEVKRDGLKKNFSFGTNSVDIRADR